MAARLMECGFDAAALARLEAPTRNRYYYGKLLDAFHFELEQAYGNRKRWLLNRLALGTGVLCGLDVVRSADRHAIGVRPGVAIDGLGREIIVPDDGQGPRAIDPRQLTDECGRPEGAPLNGAGVVTLYACYHECETEPAPSMVSRCGERTCENGQVLERYRLVVRRDRPRPVDLIPPDACRQLFAELPDEASRRLLACRLLEPPCDAPEDACVPLALIELTDDGLVGRIDDCRPRRVLYSNAMLFDMILCLAARVDQCCGAMALRSIYIVSGNGQAGLVDTPLPDPLVVRVVDGGNPVVNEQVTFEAAPGNGTIGAALDALGPNYQVNTAADGTAVLPIWRPGAQAGELTVTARIAQGTPAMVTFRAKVRPVELELPVVRLIWPTTRVVLNQNAADPVVRDWYASFLRSPRIELTFNHKMDQARLLKPKGWLRVVAFRIVDRQLRAQPVALQYGGPAAAPVLVGGGFTELFPFQGLVPGDLRQATIFVAMIRAENDNIVDTGNPPLLLDAEFVGTKLSAANLDTLWALEQPTSFPTVVSGAFADTGARLPQSGDNTPGGLFHSWFALTPGGVTPIGTHAVAPFGMIARGPQ